MTAPVMQVLDWLLDFSTWWPLVLFLGGTGISAAINSRTKYRYDSKLEQLKGDFAKEAELLRAELKARDDQLVALRTTALAGLSSRQASLDRRRMEGVDKLWASVVAKSQGKLGLQMASILDAAKAVETASRQDPEGEQMRQFGEMLWKISGLHNVRHDAGALERPFVSPLAWALFSAYQVALAIPAIQLTAIKTGVGKGAIPSFDAMLEPIKKAMPERATFIDEHGTLSLFVLIDELESKLLSELQRSLVDPGQDAATIRLAAEIARSAEQATADLLQRKNLHGRA